MKKIVAIIFCFFISSFSDLRDEVKIYENYCTAIDEFGSTYQYYLVVHILDETSNKNKEICLTGFEFVSLMSDAWNIGYEKELKVVKKLKKNKKRNFKVKSLAGLELINRIKYSTLELNQYGKKINLDSIVNSISEKEKWSYFAQSEKEQLMTAHLLFNKGILTGINECFGGMELEYYSE